jgi:RNA polymerase sigma factor (TIGR02999 family)
VSGDGISAPEAMQLAYHELHRLAHVYLRGQNSARTLEPAALVHEAYLRLANWEGVHWKSRSHFAGVASGVMRQVLCAQARRRSALKRGTDTQRVTLHSGIGGSGSSVIDAIVLEDAMRRLEERDAQACRIVEMRVFGGLTVEEIAALLEVSESTVKRSWTFAKTWLRKQLASRAPS